MNALTEFLDKFGPGEAASPTDPASAKNMLVESAIEEFQEAAVRITDRLAELSAEHEASSGALESYRAAVTEAYVAALEGDVQKCKKILRKVVNT